MRAGDRQAVGEFVKAYESRIRRRIRGKLSREAPMRRLFDSDEIFSTLTRRLDQYVSQGRLRAVTEESLWALVGAMADHALIDKARLYQRLESIEGSDGQMAHLLLRRLREADLRRRDGAQIEIEKALRALPDPQDRSILMRWLDGVALQDIAREFGLQEPTLRKRWERMRERLSVLFRRGLLV